MKIMNVLTKDVALVLCRSTSVKFSSNHFFRHRIGEARPVGTVEGHEHRECA